MKTLANAAAEQTVIGSVIANPEAIDLIATKLGPGDFHEPKIGTLFSAVARLALAGKSGGAALVEELRAAGELELVGGDKAVAYLETKATTDANKIKEAAGIVRDLATKRERAAKAYRVATAMANGVDAGVELDDLMNGEGSTDADGWTDLAGVVQAIVAGAHRRLEPTLLRRNDGAALLYANRLNWISAPPESMKSWLAKLACVQLLEQGLPAVYVDFEESDGSSCAERIVSIALGRGHDIQTVQDWVEGPLTDDGTRDASLRLFYYRAATTGLDTAARGQIVRVVRSRSVTLVVLDGVAAAMSSHTPALEEDKARDVNLWLSGFAWPLVSLGAGVLCVDHVVKNAQASPGSFASRAPRGSGAKLAAVSGTALTSTVREPGSAWTIGKVDVDVVKDRPGRVKVTTRQNRRQVATLISTPKSEGAVESTRLELLSPEEVAEIQAEKRWDLICAELASKLLSEANGPLSKTDVRDTLNERRKERGGQGWRTSTLTAAFDFLIERGWATVEKDGKTQLLGHVKTYLAEYGEQGVDDNPF
jgi:hypothetical protein